MKTHKISIAVIDDHCALCAGLKSILQKIPNINDVKTFATGREMLAQKQTTPFDIVLLDIQLKDEDGIEVCKEIKKKFENVKVLMYSSFKSSLYIYAAYTSNADGFLSKDSGVPELKMALEKILFQNERYFDTEAWKSIVYHIELEKNKQKLTKREEEMIELISEGMSGKQMAEQLFISIDTVSTHRHNILRKINGHNTADIINYAMNNGLYTSIHKKL